MGEDFNKQSPETTSFKKRSFLYQLIENMFGSGQIRCISKGQAGEKQKFGFLKNYLQISLDFWVLI